MRREWNVKKERGGAWSEQQAGIALQNWISLHGWLIQRKAASWATHGTPTVTPQKITPFRISMMASVLSTAQTVAFPGSSLYPTDTAASQSKRLSTVRPNFYRVEMQAWQLWRKIWSTTLRSCTDRLDVQVDVLHTAIRVLWINRINTWINRLSWDKYCQNFYSFVLTHVFFCMHMRDRTLIRSVSFCHISSQQVY